MDATCKVIIKIIYEALNYYYLIYWLDMKNIDKLRSMFLCIRSLWPNNTDKSTVSKYQGAMY